MAALQREAELARRRSQHMVEIGRRMALPQDQNDLISMALGEGRTAEALDHAVEFLRGQGKS